MDRFKAATGHWLAKLGRSSLEGIQAVGLPIVIGLGIASAHITLLFRGDHVPDGIAASLVWMAGAVLLSDVQEQRDAGGGPQGKRGMRWLGLMALGWCLMVLTFATRFYDPLIVVIPLGCFFGIALVEGVSPRSRTMRDLILVACLLPLQHELASSVPTEEIVSLTGTFSCVGLWGIGKQCYAERDIMMLTSKILHIDPPCAGVDTLCLAFTSSLMFLVLFPIRRGWLAFVALIGASLSIAFFVNVARVVVLAMSSRECDKHWWSQWCGFEFWHLGTGSHLFALLAVTGVCALWWWDIQRHEVSISTNGRR